MLTNDEEAKIKKLDFENFLWIVVICLSVANLTGNIFDQEYIKTKDKDYQQNANRIFEFTVTVSLLIYLYYFSQNMNNYQNVSEENKHVFLIKVIGSILLISGTLCLMYFQFNESNVEGAPDAV